MDTATAGAITSGIEPGTLVRRTIAFVESQLPLWRDDESRPDAEAEEALNGQLCKFLNARARDAFPMAFFHHEERQPGGRRVDFSALATASTIDANFFVGSIYDPFLVMEGKRLPLPSKQREREYLTGFDDRSGAVQRFRLCLHGAAHDTAVIIAYLQSGDGATWLESLNKWVGELEVSGDDKTCSWTVSDHLSSSSEDTVQRRRTCESTHIRTGEGDPRPLRLVHLWITMNKA
jgi:hypothetical protein